MRHYDRPEGSDKNAHFWYEKRGEYELLFYENTSGYFVADVYFHRDVFDLVWAKNKYNKHYIVRKK